MSVVYITRRSLQVAGRDDCHDVDECRSSPCSNGRCRNLPGSYMCDCFPGFAQSDDHKMCLGRFLLLTSVHSWLSSCCKSFLSREFLWFADIREDVCFTSLVGGRCLMHSPALSRTTKDVCCCGWGAAWGQRCEVCPRIGTPEFKRLCPLRSGYDSHGEDIDECSEMVGVCEHGRCINTMGSYRFHDVTSSPGIRLTS